MTASQTTSPAAAGNPQRRKALTALAAVVVLAGGAWGVYEWLVASHYENTDNAYVQGNVIQITPQTGGTVMSILADDTDFVQAGAPLVKLDPADARVALEQAEANLAQAVRQARTLYANNGSLAAQINLRQADVAKAQSDINRAQDDLRRRQALTGNGAVSKEELNHAQSQLDSARTALAAAQAGVVSAREQLASNQSLTQGVALDQHPNVLAAAAKVREAYLADRRTALPAPVDGYVAKRTVQLGQRVEPGTALMAVIPLDQLWIDANFKETQLHNMRIGQPVEIESDIYGSDVKYSGSIDSIGAGTGSAFALLPAQNATGNWIKIVQRVPVRIHINADQLAQHPLRVGLSTVVDVNLHDQSGPVLAQQPPQKATFTTNVYEKQLADAEALIARLIDSNSAAVSNAAAAR